MKLKLDENVDLRMTQRLRLAGHDVATAQAQELCSAPDTQVIEVCRSEERCLVTADRGFGNRGRFNPANYSGIAIIRLPNHPKLDDWCEAIDTLILGLEQSAIEGKLWIIRGNRIQEYQPLEEEGKKDDN
ncbi:MAG: DUF5615 family PIN-like protein [Cyanobacteria bacterium CRU_2_1]|nr:DUF5615 family PIN-like protein [Cyanobacteria bacterium CRU_2_1]